MGTAAKPTRENRTITVDFQDETTYYKLLGDGKAFLGLDHGTLFLDSRAVAFEDGVY